MLDTPEAGTAAIRGAALRAVGYGVGVVLSVASAAVLFRHLGVDGAGRYVLVLSLITIAQGLTESGLTAIGMRELAVLEGEPRARLVRSLLGLRLMLTLVGVLGAVVFAVAAGYDHVLVIGTVVAGAGLLVQMQQSTLSVSLMADMRLGWLTALDLLRQTLAVVLTVVFVVLGATLVPLLAVSIPAALVTLVATVVLVRGDIPTRPSFRPSEWRPMVVEVLPFAIATAVNVVYFRVAIIVTSLVAPAVQQGYFAASFRVIETLVLVPGLLVSSAFPIFSRAAHNDRDRLRYAVQRVYEAASALGVATALGLALGAPFVIEVVAGPDFKPAGPVLAVQAFALAATFPAVTWGYTLLSLRRHREMLLMNLFALGVAIVVTLVLASTHGARGAAWATVTGEVVLCLAAGFTLRRADRSMTPDLRNLPRLAVAAAAGAATALIGLPPLPTAILGVAVYLVVLWRIGGIPEEILVEVRRRFGRA